MTPLPRSAYVHVPFCAHRCGYCDFTVVAGRGDLVGDYLQAIEREMAADAPPAEVDTLYFGGGTPTQLPLDALARLCELATTWRPLAEGYEWTVEANPIDVTPERVGVMAQAGVTRMSLGGQSFDGKKLKLLERDHAGDDVRQAVALAQEAGIDACLDLIFAAPGETLDDWRRDLAEAVALAPEHISTYGLTFERGTTFWGRRRRGDLVESEEELQRSMYLKAIDTLNAAGVEHYEVSNFARPGRRSRHNLAYWSGAGYFAAGPGATRLVGARRETNHRSTTTYLRRVLAGQSAVADSEDLSPEQQAREALVFGLRKIEGVDLQWFAERFGVEAQQLAGRAIGRYREAGMIEEEHGTLRLTREGLLISDALWPDFL